MATTSPQTKEEFENNVKKLKEQTKKSVEEALGYKGVNLEDIDGSDIDDEDGDMIIEQHLTVYNDKAMERIKDDIELKGFPWDETLTITATKPLGVIDAFDDLTREAAFYNQALDAVYSAKEKLKGNEETLLLPKDVEGPTLREIRMKRKETAAEREKILKRQKKEKEEAPAEDDFEIDLEEEGIEVNRRTRKLLSGQPVKGTQMPGKHGRSGGMVKNRLLPGKGNKPVGKAKKKTNRPGKARRKTLRNRQQK